MVYELDEESFIFTIYITNQTQHLTLNTSSFWFHRSRVVLPITGKLIFMCTIDGMPL